MFRAIDPEKMIGSPQDSIIVVNFGPLFHLSSVDAGSSPGKRNNVQVTLIILHFYQAMLILNLKTYI
jgi:hypothetical protein